MQNIMKAGPLMSAIQMSGASNPTLAIGLTAIGLLSDYYRRSQNQTTPDRNINTNRVEQVIQPIQQYEELKRPEDRYMRVAQQDDNSLTEPLLTQLNVQDRPQSIIQSSDVLDMSIQPAALVYDDGVVSYTRYSDRESRQYDSLRALHYYISDQLNLRDERQNNLLNPLLNITIHQSIILRQGGLQLTRNQMVQQMVAFLDDELQQTRQDNQLFYEYRSKSLARDLQALRRLISSRAPQGQDMEQPIFAGQSDYNILRDVRITHTIAQNSNELYWLAQQMRQSVGQSDELSDGQYLAISIIYSAFMLPNQFQSQQQLNDFATGIYDLFIAIPSQEDVYAHAQRHGYRFANSIRINRDGLNVRSQDQRVVQQLQEYVDRLNSLQEQRAYTPPALRFVDIALESDDQQQQVTPKIQVEPNLNQDSENVVIVDDQRQNAADVIIPFIAPQHNPIVRQGVINTLIQYRSAQDRRLMIVAQPLLIASSITAMDNGPREFYTKMINIMKDWINGVINPPRPPPPPYRKRDDDPVDKSKLEVIIKETNKQSLAPAEFIISRPKETLEIRQRDVEDQTQNAVVDQPKPKRKGRPRKAIPQVTQASDPIISVLNE